MQLSPAIPILRSFSEAKAREFYIDFLGFEVAWEHRFESDTPLYMEIRRGDLVLHLSEHHGDGSPGMALLVHVVDLDALHAELNAKQYRHMRPGIEQRDWGREMTVWDPFGNRIRFTALPG